MNKILVTLICMMMLLTFTSVGSAEKISPMGDSFVSDSVFRNTMYGSYPTLSVNKYKRSYLIFNLVGKSKVQKAKLYLRVKDCNACTSQSPVYAYYVNDVNIAYFDESDIRWTNQMCGTDRNQVNSKCTYIGSFTPSKRYAYYAIDVTDAYNYVVENFPGRIYLNIMLSSNSYDNVDFASKDYLRIADKPKIYTDFDIVNAPQVDISIDTPSPSAVCYPTWKCSAYGECKPRSYGTYGYQTKNCNDGCGHTQLYQRRCTITVQPTSQPKCTPKWTCGSYSACKTYENSNWGYKHKTCVDGCGHSSTHKIRCTVSQPTPTSLPAIFGDLNNDRKISLSELITAIRKWSMKRYTDNQLIQIVRIYAG